MPNRRMLPATIAIAAAFAVGVLVVGPALFGRRIAPPGADATPNPADATLARHELQGCYLMFEEGRFELGGSTGSFLVVMDDGAVGDDPAVPDREMSISLSWPPGVWTHAEFLSTAIVSARGEVLATTGGRAHIGGGYGDSGTFWACGDGVASFPIP